MSATLAVDAVNGSLFTYLCSSSGTAGALVGVSPSYVYVTVYLVTSIGVYVHVPLIVTFASPIIPLFGSVQPLNVYTPLILP